LSIHRIHLYLILVLILIVSLNVWHLELWSLLIHLILLTVYWVKIFLHESWTNHLPLRMHLLIHLRVH